MPIELFTGLPGNGKTALMVERLLDAAKDASRPIFAFGVEGLEPGVATVLPDPKLWNSKDGQGNYLIPDGALIFVDEAWKWFGHLHDATRQATPPHVLSLAEHRHRGIDFVWTTQMPNQLYPFARALVANHHHVVRRFGTQLIDVYTWQELQDDPKSNQRREVALKNTRMLPKEVFDSYKSATLHTIKRKLPFRVVALPFLVVAAIFAAWLAYRTLRPDAMAAKVKGPKAAQADSAPVSVGDSSRHGPRFASTADYAAAHIPRIATMPWTAPVFDDRQVTADPQLYCMSSGEGIDGQGKQRDFSCTCYTEQSTMYDLPDAECRMLARKGAVYNPYRQQASQQSAMPASQDASSLAAGAQPASTASFPGASISGRMGQVNVDAVKAGSASF